jgi:hypothetical protein
MCTMVHNSTRFLHKINAAVLDELTRCFTSILDDCAALVAVTPFVQDLSASHDGSKVALVSFLSQPEAVQRSEARRATGSAWVVMLRHGSDEV